MVLQKSWARWLGLGVATINILLVLNVVIQGEPFSRAVLWLIVADRHCRLSPVAVRTGGGHAANDSKFLDEKQRVVKGYRAEGKERTRIRVVAELVQLPCRAVRIAS